MGRTEDWLRQAEKDLEEAEYAWKGKYYELCCFSYLSSVQKRQSRLFSKAGALREGGTRSPVYFKIPQEK